MINFKEKNIYSLNAESYGITKIEWNSIKKSVVDKQIKSDKAIKEFNLDREDKELCSKRVWFLYDKLLQEKYNHLYTREKLINPKIDDFIYCDYEAFGRGTVVKLFEDDLMLVKFDKRDLNTMCSSKLLITVHDDIKRRITRL